MEQNTNPEKQTPAPKKGMSDFRKGLLWAAIPIFICSIIGSGGEMAHNTWVGFGVLFSVFRGLAVFLWVMAILACIGFAIAHKRQVALGILAGIGIGLVGLGLTCFAAPLVAG